jgi:RNA polymerase sigma factor (sigma-70 family)
VPETAVYATDAHLARRVRDDADDAAFEQLAHRHRALLANMTRGYRMPPGMTPEDLRQEALLGLWDACTYHEGLGVFAHFARPCIRHRIYYALRRDRTRKHEILNGAGSLDTPIPNEHRGGRARTAEELVGDATADTPRLVEAREDLRLIAGVLSESSPGQRAAVARKLNGQRAATPEQRMTDRSHIYRVRLKVAALLGRAA